MKNQNDLIWSIVSLVLALIVFGVCWGTMKMPIAPAPPAPVNTSAPTYPTSTVVMDNALPNAGNSGDQAGGGRGGGGGPASPAVPGGGGNLNTVRPGGGL
jgi:hypothetical protein